MLVPKGDTGIENPTGEVPGGGLGEEIMIGPNCFWGKLEIKSGLEFCDVIRKAWKSGRASRRARYRGSCRSGGLRRAGARRSRLLNDDCALGFIQTWLV
jgi:hypothetical protein